MAENHLIRFARDQYKLDSLQFNSMTAARQVAQQMGQSAADLYALGLIDEALRWLLLHFGAQDPSLMKQAESFLQQAIGTESLQDTQLSFTNDFPPETVYRKQVKPDTYLKRSRPTTLTEILLVHLHNSNPAAAPLEALFDDAALGQTAYQELVQGLSDFLQNQLRSGGRGETLMEILSAPARVSPNSLAGQIEYLLARWGDVLDEVFRQRLLRGLDFVREEIRHTGTGGFEGEAPVLEFYDQPEYERFSQDREWMPRVVLMAKNTYVWLEQLSRFYGRWIRTLNEIPDEELDLLAQRGFTGLWLIGLWERSRASQRIKQRMGDHDAVASAYSLYAYDIAEDLGGWPALENLRARAWSREIRLSADMVPNHMGIDSKWVLEHPDWFLSLPYPPYPTYKFESENLSDDSRAAIVLEDHYYDHSDAAVVFKLHHYEGDQTRYVYHGNDGTSMPWNDTAQLDYSQAQVREAVIQTILHVARNFPIIRFDAAMTLAKKHIQRLWFPEPGAGGAIPSRSEHGMSRSEYEAALPEEFWREVVDRVAAEVPDTLLLAEAFWLMEGDFVRTLGMHRVYNSAFMHMLRDEDNAKYRQVMKNVLEFDPQVLKRFVNFMNNPDEKTAVEQFGSGDKYFGVCTLLATLPGLPMFGHGQIEGYHEKYGMEFRHPKRDEAVDEGLVQGHEWKIFPLLHRRHLFAEADHFLLYDFYTPEGQVNEDVFAYSNRYVDPNTGASERGLVIYHNKYAETAGWIKTSAAYVDGGSGDLRQKSLAEGLSLPFEGYVIFKDYVSQLEYMRSCEELWAKGLFVQLGAYQHHAFLDWRLVEEDEEWKQFFETLNGSGVEFVQGKWDEVREKQLAKRKKPAKKATRKRAAKKSAKKTTGVKSKKVPRD